MRKPYNIKAIKHQTNRSFRFECLSIAKIPMPFPHKWWLLHRWNKECGSKCIDSETKMFPDWVFNPGLQQARNWQNQWKNKIKEIETNKYIENSYPWCRTTHICTITRNKYIVSGKFSVSSWTVNIFEFSIGNSWQMLMKIRSSL